MSGRLKRRYLMDPDLQLKDAVIFIIDKSPGCVSRGVARRLYSYGYTSRLDTGFTLEVSKCLRDLAAQGKVVKDERVRESHWWPEGTEVSPEGVL